MTAPLLELREVTKRFRRAGTLGDLLRGTLRHPETVALDGVSLRLEPGTLTGLIGKNGAGKSTLLRIAAGVVLADTGTVTLAERSPRDDGAFRRHVAYALPEERSHFYRLTVRENLRFFASLHGLSGRARDDRVDAALEIGDLHAVATRTVRELSTGVRQRLSIARAMLGPEPRLLLLDEPTRSLDPHQADRLRRFVVEEVVARRGLAVLWATHQRDEMASLFPRLVAIDQGRLVADGMPSTVARVFDP